MISNFKVLIFWKEMEQKYKVGKGGELEMSNGNEVEKDNKISNLQIFMSKNIILEKYNNCVIRF